MHWAAGGAESMGRAPPWTVCIKECAQQHACDIAHRQLAQLMQYLREIVHYLARRRSHGRSNGERDAKRVAISLDAAH